MFDTLVRVESNKCFQGRCVAGNVWGHVMWQGFISRSFLFVSLSLGAVACSNGFQPADNGSITGGNPNTGYSNTVLTPFNLGSGGNVGGLDISAKGVRFARGDGFGGYIFGSDNAWH